MAAVHEMPEDEVANGIYSHLITTLKDSKNSGLLDNTDRISEEEERLVILGLELLLLYAARSETTPPSIPLPCPEDSDKRVDDSTCPPELRPYFERWAGLVPRLQCLPRDHARDLTLLVCRKPPITLPKDVPEPFPFFPTPEQHARREIRDLLSELLTISNALSTHASFASLWRGKLWISLSERNDTILSNQALTVITRRMTTSDVIAVLGQHQCSNVSHELDLASCSEQPVNSKAGLHGVYRGRLRGGTPVAVRLRNGPGVREESEGENMSRTARELHTWSKCHHPNVQPLIGLAQFRGRIATISVWMENGHIREFVNKQPGVDRFNLCTQVASGLAYLHSIEIIHGNVKGSKVLMSNLGVPMLGGFDNSRVTQGSTLLFPEIGPGGSMSPRWAAPELMSYAGARNMATDVYALGMASTILEIISGEAPYSDIKNNFALIRTVTVHKRPPVRPLKQIPPNDKKSDMLWTLLTKCWQYQPDQRPTAEQIYKHPKMKPFVVDSTMVASEIIAHLGSRNCPNLSDQLDLPSCSQYPLSNGGYGDVYRGSLKSGESVALKSMILIIGSSRLEQELLKDTFRELYTWSKCEHPNVAKLLGLAMFRDRVAMVSPWMNNGNLMSYVKRNASCAQVAEGLTYLHNINMIHADIKAANVLISDQGVAMLTDFGNSILKLSTLRFAGTETGCKISVRWTAPELFSETARYSRQADVYALGMTILETLTGEVPFPKKRDDAVVIYVVMVLKEKPSRPDCISSNSVDGDKMWSLLMDCWSHEPAKRPTAAEVRDMMKTITMSSLSPPA